MSNIHLSSLITAIIFACFFTTGCEESNQSEIKQARLTVQENLEQKEQIESLENQIQGQKDLLTKVEKEKADILSQSGETTIKMMKNLAESSRKNDELAKENQQLKERIKQLEKQLSQTSAD